MLLYNTVIYKLSSVLCAYCIPLLLFFSYLVVLYYLSLLPFTVNKCEYVTVFDNSLPHLVRGR